VQPDEELLGSSSDFSLSAIRISESNEFAYRRRKRGTRGNGRAVGRSAVTYCSLEEELHAIVNDPCFQFTDKAMSDAYRQIMSFHQRVGCRIVLANNQQKVLKPREEMGQVSKLVRAMCRLDNPVLQEFRRERDQDDETEVLEQWREHYLQTDNSVGLSLRRRFSLWQTKWALRLLGNTTKPPRC
jgi:hypothetical protein